MQNHSNIENLFKFYTSEHHAFSWLRIPSNMIIYKNFWNVTFRLFYTLFRNHNPNLLISFRFSCFLVDMSDLFSIFWKFQEDLSDILRNVKVMIDCIFSSQIIRNVTLKYLKLSLFTKYFFEIFISFNLRI